MSCLHIWLSIPTTFGEWNFMSWALWEVILSLSLENSLQNRKLKTRPQVKTTSGTLRFCSCICSPFFSLPSSSIQRLPCLCMIFFPREVHATYDYQRSLRKVQTRMFITTLMIHCSTVHDPSALKDGLHRLYICRIIRASSVCCMAVLPVPE